MDVVRGGDKWVRSVWAAPLLSERCESSAALSVRPADIIIGASDRPKLPSPPSPSADRRDVCPRGLRCKSRDMRRGGRSHYSPSPAQLLTRSLC